VKYNDMGGRYLVAQGQPFSTTFFLEAILNTTFRYWLWAAVVGVLLGLLQPGNTIRRVVLLLLTFVAGWLLVVSTSASQYPWYDAPIYPALAVLAGLGLALLYRDVLGRYQPQLRAWQHLAVQLGVGLLILLVPYHAIMRQIIEERYIDYGNEWDGHLGRYIVTLSKERPGLDSLTVLFRNDYNAVLDYYQYVHNLKPGNKMVIGGGQYASTLPARSVVVVCNPAYRAALDTAFQVVELHKQEPCQTLLLLPKP